MSNFHVGQKVVCIRDDWERAGDLWKQWTPNRPVIKGIYTVRGGFVWGGGAGIWLHEVHNPRTPLVMDGLMECGFPSEWFRPITERKTSIEVFKKLLLPSKTVEPV